MKKDNNYIVNLNININHKNNDLIKMKTIIWSLFFFIFFFNQFQTNLFSVLVLTVYNIYI